MKILAISGSGRSGSTLLSLLFSQDKTVFNLGQMRHLARSWIKDEPCTCGRGLRDCPVYAPVMDEVFGAAPQEGADAFQSGLTVLLRALSKTPDWSDETARAQLSAAHGATISTLRQLLEAIQRRTGAAVLVDSSKMPEVAMAFDLSFPGDVDVVNLTRDPRAIAVSWYRKTGSWRAMLKNLRGYAERQERLADWARGLGGRFVVLGYEDLADNPRKALSAINAQLGLPIPAELARDASAVALDWTDQHLFPPANESVLRARASQVAITPSNGWQSDDFRLQRFVADRASRKSLRRYRVDWS